MFGKRINNWFTHFKKYFFTYNNGFFELSCLLNSPKTLVESLKKMPFNKCDLKKQIMTTDNFFLKGEMHYQELEEGLWITSADMFYKTNVSFKMIYDEYLPVDYFSLSYNIIKNEIFKDRSKNNDIIYLNETWSFLKPRATYEDSHFKGTSTRHFTIYFTERWLVNNVFNDLRFNNNNFKDFFNSEDKKHVIWSGAPDFINTEFYEIIKNIHEKGNQGVANVLALKFKVYKCIQDFFLKENKNLKLDTNLSRADVLKQLKVEKFLINNLEDKFVGIDHLSKKFKISPTKLKTDFKKAHGMSLLQYFQKKQMLQAKDLIESKDLKISELSSLFGYENPSKFSKAFLKQNGNSPSFYKK